MGERIENLDAEIYRIMNLIESAKAECEDILDEMEDDTMYLRMEGAQEKLDAVYDMLLDATSDLEGYNDCGEEEE